MPPALSSAPDAPSRRSSQSLAAVDPHSAFVAFSGFGDPPSGLWASMAYATRVMSRRRELLEDLASARARNSPDVGLYEASLRTADDEVVRRGIIMLVIVAVCIAAMLAGFAGFVARSLLPVG